MGAQAKSGGGHCEKNFAGALRRQIVPPLSKPFRRLWVCMHVLLIDSVFLSLESINDRKKWNLISLFIALTKNVTLDDLEYIMQTEKTVGPSFNYKTLRNTGKITITIMPAAMTKTQ